MKPGAAFGLLVFAVILTQLPASVVIPLAIGAIAAFPVYIFLRLIFAIIHRLER